MLGDLLVAGIQAIGSRWRGDAGLIRPVNRMVLRRDTRRASKEPQLEVSHAHIDHFEHRGGWQQTTAR
jgi:hypothetical protein